MWRKARGPAAHGPGPRSRTQESEGNAMANFSTDTDILRWEPNLMRDLAPADQMLIAGSDAATSGITLTSASAKFASRNIQPGHVIHLTDGDAIDGCYQVLSVESETQLLATLLCATAEDTIDLPGGTNLAYTIHTFDPQAAEAAEALLVRFGLETDSTGLNNLEKWISYRRALTSASVFGTLAIVYRSQAAGDETMSAFARKSDLYAKLYEDELVRARLRLDRNSDGLIDKTVTHGSVRLQRD